jgi:hypothetical protein
VVLINICAFSCLYMGHFVPALNGPCSCPPMGRDLGPNSARYNGSCRSDTKLFRVVPCLGRAFFSCFGPAHQARPKCTPILWATPWNRVPFSGAGSQAVGPPNFRIGGPKLQAWLLNSDVVVSDRWKPHGWVR